MIGSSGTLTLFPIETCPNAFLWARFPYSSFYISQRVDRSRSAECATLLGPLCFVSGHDLSRAVKRPTKIWASALRFHIMRMFLEFDQILIKTREVFVTLDQKLMNRFLIFRARVFPWFLLTPRGRIALSHAGRRYGGLGRSSNMVTAAHRS
jgi:hypothetical protein